MACGKTNCWAIPASVNTREQTGFPVWHTLARMLNVWNIRIRHRRALARLSDRELEDVGLNREDLMQEVRKPFWRR